MTASITSFRRRSTCPSADRVLASHRLVEQAAHDLHDGTAGSGVRSLCFAASTHLALATSPEAAGEFFEMMARLARQVGQPDPDDAA